MEGKEMTRIITADRRMQDIIQLAKTVAQSRATVLIQAESGTGKELMAHLIHDCSSRRGKPFVAINCAAIPENLLESELFGYERGAFTGATTSRPGKFEYANGGTLLLDGISEMDVRLQAKLLRVLQENKVDRIGGRRPNMVDVRIIATTNKNLADCVKAGSFREDLYYRLNVVNLTIPTLKERIGDIEVLSNFFIQKYCEKNKRALKRLTPEALALLHSHTWPGNVRELENVIERAVITGSRESISAKDVVIQQNERVSFVGEDAEAESLNWIPGTTLDDVERQIILDALTYHKGNRTHTARALGISIRTLRNKLADYRRMGIHV